MWKKYFRFVKLKPGRVVTALLGEIDFSRDDIPLDQIKVLYESDFPYLQITEEGKAEIYGLKPAKAETVKAAETETAEIIETAIPKRGRRSRKMP